MLLEKTKAYITTVRRDHTIVAPEDVPVGAKVAVILVAAPNADEEERRARFAAAYAAIEKATLEWPSEPSLSDVELDALIEKARKAT